ncbi:hypothetical protein FHG66_13035 [Rubellimicrobium rubrum]|uniref:Uncharacterized protein n=1 Tax=Rubellimicrobium rubrum TaxID=2585369 RepID=A0A5C4MWI8_9RHOB|nr:hypothetical protein [Rubellimicrobium rubrum]TNC48736.1 hypothetical protein FHG66_13035 [Rubellimicrobium rubrum]
MNPLTVVLSMLTATAVTGPFLVAAFVLGHYNWPAILLGVLLGAFGAAALARRIEHEMKRQDPAWDEHQDRPKAYAIVRPRSDDRRDRVYSRSDRRH